MAMLRNIAGGLKSLFRRREDGRELGREVESFLEISAREKMKAGMSRADAMRAARMEIGSADVVKEEVRAWGWEARVETVWQDLRYALRCFRNAPTFAATVVLTIGLALGLNTVLFAAFNAYVLAPFSVQDPHSLYRVWWNTKSTIGRGMSWNEFQRFREGNPAFSDVVAIQRANVRVRNDMLMGELVSGNYFSMLGVPAELGRTLVPSDAEVAGSNAVIVLSHDCWKAKFGQDRSVIGRRIPLDGHPFEIVGVARRGFGGIANLPRDFWAPMTMSNQLLDGPDLFGPTHPHPLELTGRLHPGLSPDRGRAALLVFSKQLTADRSAQDKVISVGFRSNATSFPLTADAVAVFAPAFVAFGLVLLLACTNVANMMLARTLARQREIGVRLALGAARTRLVRQLLTEGLVLALGSAGFGFAMAWLSANFGMRAFFAIIPPEFAKQGRVAAISLDWRVFLYMLIAACVSAVGFALAPALQATRGDLISATRGEFAGRQRAGRLRNSLITAQVAICVMLLICSGILLRAGRRVEATDVGLDVRNVLDIDVREGFRPNVISALSSDPAVESIDAVWRAPLYGDLRGISVATENSSSFVTAGYNFVSREHFDVFRITLTNGRNFTEDEDRAEAPVVIVSGSTAHKFWPGSNAIGQTLRIQPPPLDSRPDKIPQYEAVRVIGVARDVVNHSVLLGPDPTCIYFPTNANATFIPKLLVRVRGNIELARRSIQKLLDEHAPGAANQITPMEEVLEIQYLPFRLFAWISEALGGLALILTLAGIYGVISYLTAQRWREIGIRLALGASSRAVVRLVLSQSIRLTCLGLAIGTLIAFGVMRLVSAKIVLLASFDLRVYGLSIAVVLLAAALAGAIPARHASRFDPMSILRHE
ncbi:MAG TPA: ADOP family duplicated permease [Candidatus Acidoferrales bacterium]|nr:ADOP family duplicated permease [Candidatus Acidoferrales bacterium]